MKKSIIILFMLLIILFSFAGCVQSHESAPSGVNDTIRVSGAYALYPLMLVWAEKYQKEHPGVKIVVSAGGAGKGMTDVITGQADIGMISRDISSEEKKQGILDVSVGKDAVVLTTNKNNPIYAHLMKHGLNRSELTQIFVNNTLTQWGILNESAGDKKIHVYTRSDSCGAAEVWAKYLGVKQENLKGTGVSGDPGISEAVARDELGLGYNNINYAYDPTTGLVLPGIAVIPLDINDDGIISSDENFYATRADLLKAISSGKYPSPPSRNLYLAVKNSFSGEAGKFIFWIIRDGQEYSESNGYIPLTIEEQQEMEKVTSTHST